MAKDGGQNFKLQQPISKKGESVDFAIKQPTKDESKFIPIEKIVRKDGFYVTANLPSTSAQTASNYGHIFTATGPCEVLIASEVHAVAGTSGSAVTLDIEKLTGTTALGSGSSILATAFDLKSTAYTPVQKQGTLLSTARQLVQGNRLALKTSGTLTSLQGVQVTLYIKPLGRGDYR